MSFLIFYISSKSRFPFIFQIILFSIYYLVSVTYCDESGGSIQQQVAASEVRKVRVPSGTSSSHLNSVGSDPNSGLIKLQQEQISHRLPQSQQQPQQPQQPPQQPHHAVKHLNTIYIQFKIQFLFPILIATASAPTTTNYIPPTTTTTSLSTTTTATNSSSNVGLFIVTSTTKLNFHSSTIRTTTPTTTWRILCCCEHSRQWCSTTKWITSTTDLHAVYSSNSRPAGKWTPICSIASAKNCIIQPISPNITTTIFATARTTSPSSISTTVKLWTHTTITCSIPDISDSIYPNSTANRKLFESCSCCTSILRTS